MKVRKRALVIIIDGVEEIEAVASIDILRRAEVEVTVAAAGTNPLVAGRDQIQIQADCLLADLADPEFDMLVIPGGPGHATLLELPDVIDRLKRQNEAGKWIGSICAGPIVLKKAGVLENRKFTSYPGTKEALPNRDPEALVVIDGNVVTSQGAGTAIHFGLALVEVLIGSDAALQVAESICFRDYPLG